MYTDLYMCKFLIGPAVYKDKFGVEILVGVASYVNGSNPSPSQYRYCGPNVNDGLGHWDQYITGYVNVLHYVDWIKYETETNFGKKSFFICFECTLSISIFVMFTTYLTFFHFSEK